jgi:hypothetical protein
MPVVENYLPEPVAVLVEGWQEESSSQPAHTLEVM